MENEKRLIDAERVYEMGHRTPFHIGIADLCDLKELLADVPTVDAMEVVRCKDCRFCKKHTTSDKVKMCTNEQQWATECYPLVHDDDFCSYGERIDNESTE